MNDNGAWTERRDELLERVVQQGRARKLRRRLVGAASVVLVAAVVALGVASATSSPKRSVEVLNPNGSTTTVPANAHRRPDGVLLIGDSVMMGARDALERAIPGARVNTGVSRQFRDAIPVLRAARDARALPQTVVVHLGTNGAFTTAQFSQLMQTIGPDSEVYFVTVSMPRPWQETVNADIFSDVPQWPNAHVLDWHSYADKRPWFFRDGIHLAGDGPAQYAQFIRDGIRPVPATFSDPFAGGAVPSTGLYVTSDPKWGKDQGSSSFAVSLFDDAGALRGRLPRALIGTAVTNASRRTLQVTDGGISLVPTPLDHGANIPAGCTQTEAVRTLGVALCGVRNRDQLLGERIVVNRGAGWTDLIGKPPAPPGLTVAGHWNWASPSPDGQWLLATWSGECETITNMFVHVPDGALHTVTGEVGTAWGGAPESGAEGWTTGGDALVVLGGDAACGTAAPERRGVYVVSPTKGIGELLVPLGPDAGVMRWTNVDDQRTRSDATGSTVRVDLDGDGHVDELSIAPSAVGAIGPIEMRATLADGRVVSGTYPNAYSVHIAGTADLAGDGRHEAIVTVGGETWTLGAIVVLDGDRLVAITQTNDDQIIGWGQHSNGDPHGTSDVACRVVGGKPSLVLAHSSIVGSDRQWRRTVYALDGTHLVVSRRDAGTIVRGAEPPPGLPLANALDCAQG